MRWRIAEPNRDLVKELARALNISGMLATLLVNRGLVEAESARKFLYPRLEYLEDPFLMSDLETAVSRIMIAIEAGQRILIYGDYDVDGTTAVVVLRKALDMLGGNTSYHIPRRLEDGYGMKSAVIQQAAKEGIKLIISVDTGIKAFEVVETASMLGVDCIITDHHLPESDLPDALAVLNPNRPDCNYPDKNLSGVGVAFKLVQALFMRTNKEKFLPSFLKIVAIGTIADVVPLIGENRIFAKVGLAGLRLPANHGLKSLIEISGLVGKEITSTDVGFRIAPRINAVGRMGGSAQAVELLASNDMQQARMLATELDHLNKERQQIEDLILREVGLKLEAEPSLGSQRVIVIDGDGWHRGIIGIAATKLTEKFNRPTLVLSKDNGIAYGSGRSAKGFHLLNALETCRDLLHRFGGHPQAAGFQLASQDVPELRRRVNRFAESAMEEADLEASLEIDGELRLSDLEQDSFEDIQRLSPFGPANPQPTFAARELTLIAEPRILKGKHLKFRVEQDGKALDAIGWNMAQHEAQIRESDGRVSLAFSLSQNSFQGMKSLQLVVKDVHLS
jgi:single-stranded-DNA-specific exonuclease